MIRSRIVKGIVYVSRALVDFPEKELLDLSLFSIRKNGEFSITGYLCFQQGRFIQYFEGPEDACNQLISNIDKDERHLINKRLDEEKLEKRRFPDWSMRFVTDREIVEFDLENIIADSLMFSSGLPSGDDHMDEALWLLVDSLSRVLKM